MSVCSICHVPYTRRDIYALNLSQYIDGRDRKNGTGPYTTNDGRTNAKTPKLPNGPSDSPFSTETSGRVDDEYEMSIPALLQRIRDLEATVVHRDGQIREWRR